MKPVLLIFTILILAAAIPVEAQVAPEATSPTRIAVRGNLNYSARFAQVAQTYKGTSGTSSLLSGDFIYSTSSERKPFSVNFGAGDSWREAGTTYNAGLFETLKLTQSIAGRRWGLDFGDDVAYRKGAPATGFTGQPGSGAPIGQPNPPTGATILTLNNALVDNESTASYHYKLSRYSTVSATGGYTLLRFPDGSGLDTDGIHANLQFQRSIGARNSLFGAYAFSRYSYPDTSAVIEASSPEAGWVHIWTARLTSTASAGPQWITRPDSSTPAELGVSASADVTYHAGDTTADVKYSHGVTGGGGFFYGGESDNLNGTYTRIFGRNRRSQSTLELVGGYRHTASVAATANLPGSVNGSIGATIGSVQATKRLGKYFSAFANYTGTEQSLSSAQTNGYIQNGLWSIFTIGIGFTPLVIHLRQ